MFENFGIVELISVIIMGLFGGGGIAALIKARQDGKKGIREDSRAEVDSLNARAIAIAQAQFDLLITPLKTQVNGLESDIVELNTKLKDVQRDLEDQKSKYWGAINYIRRLLTWMSLHFPDRTDFPSPPADLYEDIY